MRCYGGYRCKPAVKESEGWSSPTRCEPSSSYRAAVVMRFVDQHNFARFRLEDNKTTYYEECVDGTWSQSINVGPNQMCDADWHHWKVVVDGEENSLFIDGKPVGSQKSSQPFTQRNDLTVGFSARDTFSAVDNVRVRKLHLPEIAARLGAEKQTTE